MNMNSYLRRLWGPNIAQNTPTSSTDEAEPMDPMVKTMKDALEAIRDMATNALRQIERPQEQLSMRWTCTACGYVKGFTKPVSLETASRCARCKSTEFKPIL
jgi:predicted Zn-ribbon and HTH transcriptional regulator